MSDEIQRSTCQHTRPTRLLVVGGGHAGAVAAMSARRQSSEVHIKILGDESCLPYERPPLSKLDVQRTGLDDLGVKYPREMYAQNGIELRSGAAAIELNRVAKWVETADGVRHAYDRLILATGSRVRAWPVRDMVTARFCYLRTKADAVALLPLLVPGARVVVVGAGFIGLEVAALAVHRGAHTIVLERQTQILNRVLPAEEAEVIENLHQRHGVCLLKDVEIHSWRGREGEPFVLETSQGAIECDVVVVGIGVLPNVELAKRAGLSCQDGLVVDGEGRTSDPDIYGAGEVVRYPGGWDGEMLRLESWQMAELQAAVAGANAVGAATIYQAIPWFWTDQFSMNIQVLGRVSVQGKSLVRGDPAGAHSRFRLAPDGRIAGAVTYGSAGEMAAIKRLMSKGIAPDPSLLADPSCALKTLLAVA